MNKLTLLQIMDLSEKLTSTEWITILIKLNNFNKIEDFIKLIDKPNLLQEALKKNSKSNGR